MTPTALLQKWSVSGAAESSNAQSFTNDICVLLGVAKPDPTRPDESQNTYVFEKSVPSPRGVKKVDCYKRGHFILENKQGAAGADAGAVLSAKKQAEQRARKTGHGKRGTAAWDTAMEKARKQAENYARLLAGDEIAGGRPPFILVADVGHSIAVYADWSRAGGHYQPFPDPNNYRIPLADLAREDIRERLRLIWTDPLSLDPARRSARVTKDIADSLAKLAKSLDENLSNNLKVNTLATSNEQRATSNEQRATSNEQRATSRISHALSLYHVRRGRRSSGRSRLHQITGGLSSQAR
ncbi:type IIL restriction-modification enzyme MmeI [Neolewinella antarctica]|uniref:MmeI-like N-terminal domain-containing protein n=1 Tax=Neolewinella antarctica TaxID=442734 RepID=A0ABX0XFI1_9BACT|nr:type IIL restriction-modification enzyme MmeI [Neolewinella antarctica]NJC28075.1 hypothetical protein [Neolewinella antarctica]